MSPMQCNIDRKGRVARAVWGVLMLLLAGGAGVMGWYGVIGTLWASVAAVLFTAFGLFAFYEARKGWCAVRAMGFKTRM